MKHKRNFAVAAAGATIAPLLMVALPASPASAHGYISTPPSRQANCAAGKVSNCGPVIYEPQSVEGPKGQKNCNGGLSQFAQLNDDSKNWPAASVGNSVNFTWTLTARHATSTWEYFIGSERVAVFNDNGAQPGATKSHTVNLGGKTGRVKLLAVWNIADTAMAFYSCVDLQVGGGGTTTTPPTTTTTQPTTTTTRPTTTTTQPTTTTTPPQSGTWAAGTSYATGATVTYNGASYRCLQGHTAITGWEPSSTPALWAKN
ncbi:lytic polysaccharide monooxygenase [Actinokineospora cianjurensis]|uniref:Chitin-binding protein n=1 Tax=Actinokineospora cianjurensis TaxID=585224 RepID=A0A421AUP8_9PSEU|nr:lytic polysaccharide monooxygenase [Actinokineospora cianjurensis]RLK53819.1 chitin-binding protein [Actinokineospora cianjurensis]